MLKQNKYTIKKNKSKGGTEKKKQKLLSKLKEHQKKKMKILCAFFIKHIID